MDVARPYVYLVPDEMLSPALRSRAATMGVRHYEALFAFDLDELLADRHYTGLRFEVRLADEDAVALRLGVGETALEDVVGPGPGTDGKTSGARTRERTPERTRERTWERTGERTWERTGECTRKRTWERVGEWTRKRA